MHESAQRQRDSAKEEPTIDAQQRDGVGDMDPEDFRRAAHRAVDIMADYLAGVGDRPVMPQIEPGTLANGNSIIIDINAVRGKSQLLEMGYKFSAPAPNIQEPPAVMAFYVFIDRQGC